MEKKSGFKKYLAGIFCLVIVVGIFGGIGSVMGLPNMLNTIMKTAHDLLLNTVFYLMAICVITGALGAIFVEFGVVSLLERILRPLMRPLFNLPGVASLGAVMTFLSDNPAIISLAKDKRFSTYFKKYQFISLTNFGTSFGMGLLVIVFMISQGFFVEPFIGLVGAMIGCIVSTRLMQRFILKAHPNFKEEPAAVLDENDMKDEEAVKETSMFTRILNALLDGGKTGVDVGLSIIPGVLIISTFVMILTFTTGGNDVYDGAAYEGVGFLPWLFGKVNIIFEWLFGFEHPALMAFPITALGAVGAALGLIPGFIQEGWVDGNAIAVFTAIGMCWSGYLSTHTAMLDALGYRKLTPKAIAAHTIGGLVAAISAHWIFVLYALVFGTPATFEGGADRYEPMQKREVIAFEMVGENQIRVGDRVFTDNPEDKSTDDRSLANYIFDYLKANSKIVADSATPDSPKINVAEFIFDEDLPEDMYESLYREVRLGFSWYKDEVAMKYFKRPVNELTDEEKAQLEEIIPFRFEREQVTPLEVPAAEVEAAEGVAEEEVKAAEE